MLFFLFSQLSWLIIFSTLFSSNFFLMLKSIFPLPLSSSCGRVRRPFNSSSPSSIISQKLNNPFEKENLMPSIRTDRKNSGFIRSRFTYGERQSSSAGKQHKKFGGSRDKYRPKINNSERCLKNRTQDICFQILKEKQREQELSRLKIYGPDIMRFTNQTQFCHSPSDYFKTQAKEFHALNNNRRVFTESIQIYGCQQPKPLFQKRFQKREQTQECQIGGKGKGKIKKILSWNSERQKMENQQQNSGSMEQNSKELPSFGNHEVTPGDFYQPSNKFEKMKSSLTLNSIFLSSKKQKTSQEQDFQAERFNLADCYQSKNNFQQQTKRSSNRSSGFFQKKRERGDPFKMSYRSQNSQIIQSNIEEENAYQVGFKNIPQFITFESRDYQLIQL